MFSGEFKVRSLLSNVKRLTEGDSKARHTSEVPDFGASFECFGPIRTLTKRDLRVLGVLVECNTLIRQITALCEQAERESQISRCVELNLRTKGREGSLREAIRRMD